MKTELQTTLDWDINLEPVIINNKIDSGKRAIIRTDSDEILGIVGKNYKPVTNQELMEFTNVLTKSGEFELKGFDELHQGKIVLAFLKNTNPYLTINGCENEEYMFIGNSFDGSKRFHIGTASNLLRCSNQFTSTLKVYSKKHNSGLDISETVAKDIIQTYKAKKAVLYESFNGMETVRVDETVVDRLIKEIYNMLGHDSKAMKQKDWKESPSMQILKQSIDKEINDLGNNAFGLFNGVTWYTTHEMRTADSMNSQINGTASLINQKAFRFCNNLKRNAKHLI
jgi:hypothetical protein